MKKLLLLLLLLIPRGAVATYAPIKQIGVQVHLDDKVSTFQTEKFDLDPQTESVTVRIKRPTTLDLSVNWNALSQIKVTIVLELDGVKYEAKAGANGGVLLDQSNNEISYFSFRYTLPWGFFGGEKSKRLGETGTIYQAYVEVENLKGEINSSLEVDSVVAPAPNLILHHSVAFDTFNSSRADGGNGVLSLSITANGTDRLALMAVSLQANFSSSAGTMTYGGSSATLITAEDGFFAQQSAYYFIAPPASSQTVTSTLTQTTPVANNLCVITLTGADQSIPVPAADVKKNEASSASSPDSLTVTNVGSSDMDVDSIYFNGVATASPGANQTTQVSSGNGANPDYMAMSTKLGSNGGVMTWTWSGGIHFTHVAFRVATCTSGCSGGGGGGSSTPGNGTNNKKKKQCLILKTCVI